MLNLKVIDLLQLPENEFKEYVDTFEFERPLNFINAWPHELRDPYKAKPIEERSFGEVRTIINLGSNDIVSCFEMTFGIDRAQLFKKKATDFFPAFNWLKNQVKEILERESEYLKGEKDVKWIAAGGTKMNKFGDLNVLIALAKEYGTTPQEIESWDYNLVFSLLYHQTELTGINKKYHKMLAE